MFIYIEGNIGAGKTTFIEAFEKYFKKKNISNAFIKREPVDQWVSTKDSTGKNLLEYFYSDTKKYGFAFQMNAFISRTNDILEMKKKNGNESPRVYNFVERSVFTDKNVFMECNFKRGNISEIEYNIYQTWFKIFSKQFNFEKSAQSVSSLLAMLSHEIKNPLSGIKGAAQIIEKRATFKNNDLNLIKLINNETERIKKLLNSLESFLKLGRVISDLTFVNKLIINQKLETNSKNIYGFKLRKELNYDFNKILQFLPEKYKFLIKNITQPDNKSVIYSNFYDHGFKTLSIMLLVDLDTVDIRISVSDRCV